MKQAWHAGLGGGGGGGGAVHTLSRNVLHSSLYYK